MRTLKLAGEQHKDIINFFIEKGYEWEVFEGCMLDNFLLELSDEDAGKYGFNFFLNDRFVFKKYIILKEKYLNCWSSCYELITTDDKETYWKHYDMFNQEIEEDEVI